MRGTHHYCVPRHARHNANKNGRGLAFGKNLLVFAVVILGLSSCNADLHPEVSQKKFDVNQTQSFLTDVVEVNGLCSKGKTFEPCEVSDVPKYYRQIIDAGVNLSYGEFPNTISNFDLFRYYKNGFLIPDYVGYKYLSDDPNPGYAGKTKLSEGLDNSATIYEIFVPVIESEFPIKIPDAKKISEFEVMDGCKIFGYSRDNQGKNRSEKVVVIYRTNLPSLQDGLKCSALGHLYYFGIKLDGRDMTDFLEIRNRAHRRIVLHIDKISEELNYIQR